MFLSQIFHKKLLLSALVVLTSISSAYGAKKTEGCQNTYGFVGQQLMTALGGAEQLSAPDTSEQPKLTMTSLSDKQKLAMAFELFGKMEQGTTVPELVVNAMADVDFYQQVFPKLDNTITACGKAVLAHELAQPSCGVVRERQALIGDLVANRQLGDEVRKLLLDAYDAEAALFSFQLKEAPLAEKAIDSLYFNSGFFKGFNKNPTMLELATRLDNIGSVKNVVFPVVHDVVSNYFGLWVATKLMPGAAQKPTLKKAVMLAFAQYNILTYLRGIKHMYNGEPEKFLFLDQLNEDGSLPAGINLNAMIGNRVGFDLNAYTKHLALAELIMGPIGAGMSMHHAYTVIKNEVKHIEQVRDIAHYLQTRLIGVASYVHSVQRINELAKKYPHLKAGLRHFGAVEKLCEHAEQTSHDLQTLINLLNTDTFKGEASYFSLTGRILAAYKLMGELKDELLPAMEALGELDACTGMASLYKSFEGQRVAYSFVEFCDSARPYIKLDDFWNPVVDARRVVPNSIELGDGTCGVILTGANTAGKSTVLKSILLNVMLAHTFGIVPAAHAVMNPMEVIGSSLHVADDTAAGISHFKAESLRAQGLLHAFKAINDGHVGIVVIDELFGGTAPAVGQEQVCRFAREMADFGSTLFIIATHYEKVTELEASMQGVIKNYKVDVKVAADGTVTRPYKLEEGVCTTNIANAILDEAKSEVEVAAEEIA